MTLAALVNGWLSSPVSCPVIQDIQRQKHRFLHRQHRNTGLPFPIPLSFALRCLFFCPVKNTALLNFCAGLCTMHWLCILGSRPAYVYRLCTLLCSHLPIRPAGTRTYRDHDNIELNAVSDAIALFVMYRRRTSAMLTFLLLSNGGEGMYPRFCHPAQVLCRMVERYVFLKERRFKKAIFL